MQRLELLPRAMLGSLVAVACATGKVGEVGDVNTGGTVGAGGADVSGGSGADPYPVAVGGTIGAGGTNSGGGGSTGGGAGPDGESVSVFAAWSEAVMIRGFLASWRNETDHSIFVDSHCAADWWRREGNGWVLGAVLANVCPNPNVRLVELLPGQTLHASASANLPAFGAGIYRLRGTYWVGCKLGGDCTSSYERTSPEVWVVLRASQGGTGSAGAAGAPNSGEAGTAGAAGGEASNSGQLHATCGEAGPCPGGQTAIAIFGSTATCTCEIPCEQGSTACPPDTTCTYVSDGLGSLCQ